MSFLQFWQLLYIFSIENALKITLIVLHGRKKSRFFEYFEYNGLSPLHILCFLFGKHTRLADLSAMGRLGI